MDEFKAGKETKENKKKIKQVKLRIEKERQCEGE